MLSIFRARQVCAWTGLAAANPAPVLTCSTDCHNGLPSRVRISGTVMKAVAYVNR